VLTANFFSASGQLDDVVSDPAKVVIRIFECLAIVSWLEELEDPGIATLFLGQWFGKRGICDELKAPLNLR
jgi:hypothetical protein